MRFEIRLFLVFSAFFLGVVGLVLFINIRAEKELVKKLEENLKNVVQTVHLSSLKLSAERGTDRQALEQFIKEVKSKKGVREVSVVGSSREVIASSNPKKLGQKGEITGQEMVVREEFGVRDSSGHYVHYEVKVPLMREGRVIGLVQISIFLDDFRYLLRQIHLKSLLVMIVSLLLAFGAAFFVLHRLNRPLRELTGAAERVAAGDVAFQLKESGKDEVSRLTATFNVMTQKLSEQKQVEERLRTLEKQEILAETASTLAHEIRNPLNLINLTADHLGHQFQPAEKNQRRAFAEHLAGLKAQVEHLNQMVEDFLTLGRPAKLKKTDFLLIDLLHQVRMLVKRQLAAKRIEVEIGGEVKSTIAADQEQMRLVFLNLLLNAIEAVPEGGKIQISVAKKPPKEVIITVRDSGAGIATGDLEKVFEPYFSKRPGGTGLGLALAKRIVEDHGGKIRAVDNPAGGAQIEIRLPIEG